MWQWSAVSCLATSAEYQSAAAPQSLKGKVAIVTGGTGSIGFAVAEQLAEAGVHVALVDLNAERCEEMAKKLPTRSMGIAFDVSSEQAVLDGVELEPAAVLRLASCAERLALVAHGGCVALATTPLCVTLSSGGSIGTWPAGPPLCGAGGAAT